MLYDRDEGIEGGEVEKPRLNEGLEDVCQAREDMGAHEGEYLTRGTR